MDYRLSLIILVFSIVFYSCEKDLESVTFSRFGTDTFFLNAGDAKAAVTASYRGMRFIWGTNNNGANVQSSFMTDELVCSWGWAGWHRWNALDLAEDFAQMLYHYNSLMPNISEITMNIDRISAINMDESLKQRYIAELKGLRAIYSQKLFELYGPVPIRIDPAEAGDPTATPIPRPTIEWMVNQIEKDYQEAAAVLPVRFTGDDYGRVSSAACFNGLLELYINQKRWGDAITTGRHLTTLGYELIDDYDANFTMEAKGGNSEIILALPARADANANAWLAHALVSNYVHPSGQTLMAWGGYKTPWPTFDKFDPQDLRRVEIMDRYPSFGGEIFDTRANNYIGAIPKKYGPDPGALGANHGTDIIAWRYSSALLYLAEAINEQDGPTQEAHEYLNIVRRRAEVPEYDLGTLTKDQFRNVLMDERLFEVYTEGYRRMDMIRWGTFLQRAIDNGSPFVRPGFELYPIPRTAITESEGVVEQNPAYR
jgi:starch-binding outer membrane protein, SusD/RagB family